MYTKPAPVMTKTSLWIPTSDYDALRQIGERSGVGTAQLIRRLVRGMLDHTLRADAEYFEQIANL